jgi:hypothetical protein
MKLDCALVNRALLNLGMEPITPADREAENEAWRTAKAFYLQTMLEALEQVEWTSAKRRRELTPAPAPHLKNADFAYAYDLPLDCAKPIELEGREYFELEGFLLYTDAAPARLLYITTGRRMRRTLDTPPVIAGGDAGRNPHSPPEHITGGDAGRAHRVHHADGAADGGDAERGAPPDPADDFPDYWTLHLEPAFYLYWENLLSAKYALRLTGKPDLSAYFFNKAQAIGKQAQTTSAARSAARRIPAPSWQEQLGLPC